MTFQSKYHPIFSSWRKISVASETFERFQTSGQPIFGTIAYADFYPGCECTALFGCLCMHKYSVIWYISQQNCVSFKLTSRPNLLVSFVTVLCSLFWKVPAFIHLNVAIEHDVCSSDSGLRDNFSCQKRKEAFEVQHMKIRHAHYV